MILHIVSRLSRHPGLEGEYFILLILFLGLQVDRIAVTRSRQVFPSLGVRLTFIDPILMRLHRHLGLWIPY